MTEMHSIYNEQSERGPVAFVKSPVECSRSLAAFQEAVGSVVLIDGEKRTILGIEMNMPGFPLRVGEVVGLLLGGGQYMRFERWHRWLCGTFHDVRTPLFGAVHCNTCWRTYAVEMGKASRPAAPDLLRVTEERAAQNKVARETRGE